MQRLMVDVRFKRLVGFTLVVFLFGQVFFTNTDALNYLSLRGSDSPLRPRSEASDRSNLKNVIASLASRRSRGPSARNDIYCVCISQQLGFEHRKRTVRDFHLKLAPESSLERPLDFENARQTTEQRIKRLLGSKFRIDVTDEVHDKSSIDPRIFELWFEFIEAADIGQGFLQRIILTYWDSEQFFTPVDGVMIDIEDTAGAYDDRLKSILLNVESHTNPSFVAYHEFSEAVLTKYKGEYTYISHSQKEYLVDYLAWQILLEINSAVAKRFKEEKKLRHRLDKSERKKVERIGNRILSKVRLSRVIRDLNRTSREALIDLIGSTL